MSRKEIKKQYPQAIITIGGWVHFPDGWIIIARRNANQRQWILIENFSTEKQALEHIQSLRALKMFDSLQFFVGFVQPKRID
jgi:hypothetical protein